MINITCSKCQKDGSLSYVTSCGDLILCDGCAKLFLANDDCNCPKCGKKVGIMPYNDALAKNEVICTEHQKQCDYFCKVCQEYLCGDCILDQLHKQDSKHKGHKCIKIEELYNLSNQQTTEALTILQPLYNNISLSIKKYKSVKAKIESTYDDTLILMHNSFNKVQSHIEKTKKEYETKILESASKNEQMMKKIQEITNTCDLILKSNDSQIISAACSISNRIDEVVKEAKNDQEDSLPTLPKNIFTNEITPPFSGFTIVIPKFLESYKSNNFQTIYSPSVDMYHGKWRTKILLSEKENVTNLSIFIEFLNGIGGPLLIEYKVQINHPTKNEILSKTFKSEFNVMDSWGWLKFATMDTIINNGFVKDDDTLSLDIKLRPASYAEYSKIFEKLLAKYKTKYKELKQKRKNSEMSVDENTSNQKV